VTDPVGVARFARFAAPPNRRGYCGPDEFASPVGPMATDERQELRRSAREFLGAYPYLELLAGAAGLDDPLADVAVEAYWIGNPIAARVSTGDLGRSVSDRFRTRTGANWSHLELAVPGAICNHAFHVLVASPWVGLMRGGVVEEPLAIVDDCRVSWGTVVSAPGGRVFSVERTPLEWRNGRLVPGAPQRIDVTSDLSLSVGDTVALHWGCVCDVLSDRQLGWLRHVTASQLALSHHVGRPC
jgi:hypothetical protein